MPLPQPAPPKDFIRSSVLLLLREEPAHGYELIERAAAFGFDRGDAGRLYRILRKLEDEGSVRSAWEPSASGPQRRIYQITRSGAEELHLRATALVESATHIQQFLGRYEEFVTVRRRDRASQPSQS